MWAYLLLHRERNILEEDFEDKRGNNGGMANIHLPNPAGLNGRPVIKCTNMKKTEEVECPELKAKDG